MGRTLSNALLNLSVLPAYESSLARLGFALEDVLVQERDAALGNGGLGRLAACYLDSSATQELPVWGYGLRYKYGIFQQLIKADDGTQLEAPDPWLEHQNPWELPRLDVVYEVRFYGTAERWGDGSGKGTWSGGQEVLAVSSLMTVCSVSGLCFLESVVKVAYDVMIRQCSTIYPLTTLSDRHELCLCMQLAMAPRTQSPYSILRLHISTDNVV